MKKTLLGLLLLSIVLMPAFSQINEQQLYEQKIRNFDRLKNAGWIMTGVGAGITTAGGILLLNAEHDSNDNEDWGIFFEDVAKVYVGAVLLEVGIGLLAGGITMGSIGSHKSKSYRRKLDNLSVGMVYSPNRKGLSLVYRF